MVDLALLQSASYIAGALGVCMAAFYYVMNLRAQQENMKQTLQTRQAQMFMSIYQQTKSDEFNTAIYKVIGESKWSSFKEYWNLWEKDPEFRRMSDNLGNFYEGLGVLVREGMLNIRWVALLFCAQTRRYWEKYLPIVEEGRRTLVGNKRWWSESEYLYTELMRYLKDHPELDSRISNTK